MCKGTTANVVEPPTDTSVNKFLIINMLSYILNTFVTFSVDTLFGRPGNGELSDKYQSILSASGTAFSIWGIIFLVQALWTVVQWLPSFRNSPYVLDIGYGYAFVCLMQAGWTVAFSFEIQWLAYLFMLSINIGLNYCVHQMQKISNKTMGSYFLWQFPFSIHCGWIFAATALNTNVLAVASKAPVNVEIGVAAGCLLVLLVVAMTWLSSYPADLTIPLVLVWALGWIYAKLQAPRDSIVERFSTTEIDGFAYAVLAGAVTIFCGTLLKVVYVCFVQRPRARKLMEDKDDIGMDEEHGQA